MASCHMGQAFSERGRTSKATIRTNASSQTDARILLLLFRRIVAGPHAKG